MITKRIILFALFFILMFSCKEKQQRTYYESGELFTEKYKLENSDELYVLKEFYKNGKIKQEGILKADSIPNGYWRIFYGDGKLRWEGSILNGVIQHHNYSQNWKWTNRADFCKGIEVEGNPKKLFKGISYNFRVIMPQIHPKLYVIVDKNYNPIKLRDSNNEIFPYTFTATDIGSFYIFFVFMNEDGKFLVGNPTSYAELKIE